MKNKVFWFFALLFVYGFSSRMNAQNEELTLKNAVIFALKNKAESKKGRLEIENSEYKIQDARSKALPQIDLNGSLVYNPILQLSALPGEFSRQPGTTLLVPMGQKWTGGGGISLKQTIFDLSVFTGLKAAKTTREFYRINAELTDEKVIENVAQNYYQVYIQKQKLKVVDSNFVNTTKVKNIIAGQYKNGLAKKIDLDRMTVNLSNISTQRQQLINEIQLQENALKFYMGMPIQNTIKMPEINIEANPALLMQSPEVEKLAAFRALKSQESLLVYQKKSVSAGYYPTLSLSGSYNYQGTGNSFPLFAGSSSGVNWFDAASVGLNLKIPLFTGFGTKAKVRQADVELRSLQVDLEDTKLSLELDFENARVQAENSINTIANQKENVKLAQQVLSDINNNYQNGLASLTDLLDAESSFIDAQNLYSTALLDYKLAEIQLIKSKGELKSLQN
jgi:outer membrane protein